MPKTFRSKAHEHLRRHLFEPIPRAAALGHLSKIVSKLQAGEEPSFDSLKDEESDAIERVIASILSSLRANRFKKDKSTFKPRDMNSTERRQFDNLNVQMSIKMAWADHVSAADTNEGYAVVAEPYGLGEEDLRELVALCAAGWQVRLDERFATYFPGHASCVMLLPPKKELSAK